MSKPAADIELRDIKNVEQLGSFIISTNRALKKSDALSIHIVGKAMDILLQSIQFGGSLPDGTVCFGRDRENKIWATTPKMLPHTATWWGANKTHKLMLDQGVSDHNSSNWAVPNPGMGRVLFELRDEGELKGTFAKSEFPDGITKIWLDKTCYGKTQGTIHDPNYAYVQSFEDDGADIPLDQGMFFNSLEVVHQGTQLSVRPIRRVNDLTADSRAIGAFLQRQQITPG